jgi:hypothetical protein
LNLDRYWTNMAHAMIKYKHELDSQNISLEICNEFIDGYYLPSEKKILLCANTLTNFEKTTKFDRAIKRHVNIINFLLNYNEYNLI